MKSCWVLSGRTLALGLALTVHAYAQDLSPDLATAYQSLMTYDTGGDTAPLEKIRSHVDAATGSYAIRLEAEPKLFDVLISKRTPDAAKKFAGEQLYRIVDEDSVKNYSTLLFRTATAPYARRGLELINDSSAQKALLDALERAPGGTLTGIIESLGNRADVSAVRPLRRFALSGNTEIMKAALSALGKIGGADAAEALDWCRVNVKRSVRAHATQAYLQCGWRSIEIEAYDAAEEVFEVLMSEVEPMEVREEALRGLIRAQRNDAVPLIIEVLNGREARLHAVAAAEAGYVPGPEATEAFANAFPDLSAENQITLLAIFGERADSIALPTVLRSVNHRTAGIRAAALRALGKFNDADALTTLLRVAGGGTPDEQIIARDSLAKLNAPDLNQELVKAAMSADNLVRSEAIKAMVDRRAENGVEVLIRIARRDVEGLRVQALDALGTLASVEDLEPMVALHVDAWNDASREAIASSIVTVAQRSAPGPARTDAITTALTKGSHSTPIQLSLVHVLGEIGDDSGIEALASVATRRDSQVSKDAIGILAAWPNPAPLKDLEKIVRGLRDGPQRAVAYEGFVRLLVLHAEDAPEDALKYFQRAQRIAQSPDEKRRLLDGARSLPAEDALSIVERYLKDKDVADYAARIKGEIESGR